MDIDIFKNGTFDMLERYEGDGVYTIMIPELDFPIEGYVYLENDGMLSLDEKSIKL